jgi:DNA invertase Pin-like site-specific DNA recombinase
MSKTGFKMSPLIAYYRVSTRKQGQSGLGLEAQRRAVKTFAEFEKFTVVAEFIASDPNGYGLQWRSQP